VAYSNELLQKTLNDLSGEWDGIRKKLKSVDYAT
jgi:hypothetical protein